MRPSNGESNARRGAVALALVSLLACTPASQGLGTSTGAEPASSSIGASTGGLESDGSASASASATSVGSVSASATASADGTTTSDGTTSLATSHEGDGTTSTDGTTGTSRGEDSSSGGTDPIAYPPCAAAEPRCPEPYEGCIEPMGGAVGNACTLYCGDASECPLPDSGGATVVCAAPMMMPDFCQLDCSQGECPAGMECVGLGPMGQALRCLWPPV
jgi:hypothetical protein